MNMELRPNFTPRAQEAIINSRKVAQSYKRRVVSEDHLAYSLSNTESLNLLDFYLAWGFSQEDLISFLEKKLTEGDADLNKQT